MSRDPKTRSGVDGLLQADGGYAPSSKETAACTHALLRRSSASWGPFPEKPGYHCFEVPSWRCEACGSGFTEFRDLRRVARQHGVHLDPRSLDPKKPVE